MVFPLTAEGPSPVGSCRPMMALAEPHGPQGRNSLVCPPFVALATLGGVSCSCLLNNSRGPCQSFAVAPGDEEVRFKTFISNPSEGYYSPCSPE